MTARIDFDRLLAEVLDADGPRSAPTTLVDDALQVARAIPQRRPFLGALDGRAWPRRGAFAIDVRRRAAVALIALVVLLAAAIIGAATIGRRPPSLLAPGERAFVYADGVAHVLTADGTAASAREVRRSAGCPVLVPGTTTLVSMSFGSYTAQDVTSGDVTARIPIGAGWEMWSSSRRTLALYDSDARRLNVVDFSEGGRASGWMAARDLAAIAWSSSGDDELLLFRATADGVEVDRFDVRTGELTSAVTRIADSPPTLRDFGHWSPDRRTVAIGDGALLDLPSGQVTISGSRWRALSWAPDSAVIAAADPADTIMILDRDGRTVAAGLGAASGPPTWSPSGRDLAFRDAAGVTVVARDGSHRRSLVLDRTATFTWAGDDALLVARTVTGGSISLTRYAAADLSPIAQTTSAPSPDERVAPDPEGLCLQFDAGSAGS